MGYRTDGVWLIRGTVEDITSAMVSARMNFPVPAGAMDLGFDSFEVYEARYNDKIVGYIKFEFDSWKWYESYTDIQWLERLWAHWSENPALSGTRIHVGEEEDDIQVLRFGDDPTDVYVSRSIEIGSEATVGNDLFNKEQTCN
jgi:hypothetical protein